MTSLETMAQWVVFVLGGAAIWLISDDRSARRQRWGWLLGFFGQPFWIWITWENAQWGMFALSVWFLFVWGKGAWRRWLI